MTRSRGMISPSKIQMQATSAKREQSLNLADKQPNEARILGKRSATMSKKISVLTAILLYSVFMFGPATGLVYAAEGGADIIEGGRFCGID